MGVARPTGHVTNDEIAVARFLHEHPSQRKKFRTIAALLRRSERSIRRALANTQKRVRAKRAEPTALKQRRDFVLSLVRKKKTHRNAATGKPEVVGRLFPSLRTLRCELGRKGFTVSVNTVRRDAISRGIAPQIRQKVGKNSPEKLAERVTLSKKMLRVAMKHFLFCDETWTNTNDNTCRTEQVPPGETATPRVFMKHPTCKLLVWALIGIGRKGPLLFFDSSITGEVYSKTCGEAVRAALDEDVERRWFVHDNARPHLALGRELVEEGYNVAQWPPYSPDLNPIETVWATLHRKVSERFPKTLEELKAATTAAWDTISQREIDAHCKSFHKRLRFCIEHAGKHGG